LISEKNFTLVFAFMAHLITLTQEMLNKALNAKGNLSWDQFRALGYDGPFKNWKDGLVGTLHDPGIISQFILLKKKGRKNRHPTSDYNDPRWIKKRNLIYKRDGYSCVNCKKRKADGAKLAVHHLLYIRNREVWEVPDWYLVTLCGSCHKKEHGKRLSPPPKHFKK
jgi:hypothetical protein